MQAVTREWVSGEESFSCISSQIISWASYQTELNVSTTLIVDKI